MKSKDVQIYEYGLEVKFRDIYTGKEIETFPAHKSELKKLFPHSNIQLIICLPNQIVLMLSCGKTF